LHGLFGPFHEETPRGRDCSKSNSLHPAKVLAGILSL